MFYFGSSKENIQDRVPPGGYDTVGNRESMVGVAVGVPEGHIPIHYPCDQTVGPGPISK